MQSMPRASDVDRDMTNGERVEVKYAPTSRPRFQADNDRISGTPNNQPKKIVIPAIISMSSGSTRDMANNQSFPSGWPAPSLSFSTTVRESGLKST